MPAKQEVYIEKVIFGGAGLGRLEGKVCLVNDVIAGETVQVRVRQEKKGFMRGRAIRIDKASSERVEAPCAYVKQCGGCQYQHMTYEEQLRVKESQVTEALLHGLKLAPALVKAIQRSPLNYHYRNHVTLHPKDLESAEPQRLGYISRDRRSLVPVDECLLADPKLQSVFKSEIPNEKKKERITFWVSEQGEVLSDTYPAAFKLKIRGRNVWTHSQGFFQNNIGVTEKIIDHVQSLIGEINPEIFIDLYAGMGLFSLTAASEVSKVICAEENPFSLAALKENYLHEESRVEVLEGRVEKKFTEYVQKNSLSGAFLFLDPPRTGMDESLAKMLSSLRGIDRIVYLACDLPILVRDLKILLAGGLYQVKEVTPYDMFPQTKHIEILAVLEPVKI